MPQFPFGIQPVVNIGGRPHTLDHSKTRMRAARCRPHPHQMRSPLRLEIPLTASSAPWRFFVWRILASRSSDQLSIITASFAAHPRPFVPHAIAHLRSDPPHRHADGQDGIPAIKDQRVPTFRARSRIAVRGTWKHLHDQWSCRVRIEVRLQVRRVNMASRRSRHSPHARRVLVAMVQRVR